MCDNIFKASQNMHTFLKYLQRQRKPHDHQKPTIQQQRKQKVNESFKIADF